MDISESRFGDRSYHEAPKILVGRNWMPEVLEELGFVEDYRLRYSLS